MAGHCHDDSLITAWVFSASRTRGIFSQKAAAAGEVGDKRAHRRFQSVQNRFLRRYGSVQADDRPAASARVVCGSRPLASIIFRTGEYPFECEGRWKPSAISTSPSATRGKSMISDFFDYADAETRHIVIFAVIHARHISAVSPPRASAQPDCRRPSAIPLITLAAVSTSSLPVA